MATVLQEIGQKKFEREMLERFTILPDILKTALTSEKNFDASIAIAKSYNLTEKQVAAVAQIVGEVLLGLILPATIAQELIVYFDINEEIAHSIQRNLGEKIFTLPIRIELEKNYKPIPRPIENNIEISEQPEKSFSVASMPIDQKRAIDQQMQKSFKDFLRPSQKNPAPAISTPLQPQTPQTPTIVTPPMPRPFIKIPVTVVTPLTAKESPTNSLSHKTSEGFSSSSLTQQTAGYSAKENKKNVSDENIVDLRKFIGDPNTSH